MSYSQNITMPAQSKKSAAPAKWLGQRSAFCTLGIYRPLRPMCGMVEKVQLAAILQAL